MTLEFRDISTNAFVGENTLTFRRTDETDYTQATLAALCAEIADFWNSDLKSQVSNEVRLQRLYARGLANQADAYFEALALSAATYSGARVPSNVTLAVGFRTPLTGRNHRGRVFMCGLPATVVSEDQVSNTYAASLLIAWEQLPTYLGVLDQHVVLSRYLGGELRNQALATPVTSYTLADQQIDTRRKRLG